MNNLASGKPKIAGDQNGGAEMKNAGDDEKDDGDFLEIADFFEGVEHVGSIN